MSSNPEELVKQEATTLVTPEKVPFWNTTLGKAFRATIYLAVSGALTALINEAANNPDFLGAYTDLFILMMNNVGLVLVKNFLDPEVKNI